ncbi:MAG: response regulator transcription factor [Bacteroidetes bacterium]|nr:response regulator transcription factor [Bacteroidota bacterium]
MSNNIRYLIVEDEPKGADLLLRFATQFLQGSTCVGIAQSVSEAIKLIQSENPDLVFLDIEIKEGTGFQVLDQIKRNFQVVFTTGYNQYAIKAIKYGAYDYLLKPLQIDEFKQLALKFQQMEEEEEQGEFTNPFKDNFSRITILHKGIREHLPLNDILLLSAEGKYSRIHLNGNRNMVSSYNLGYYEDLLSDAKFLRIHHGFLVNLQHVVNADIKNLSIELTDGKEYPISQRKLKVIRDMGI